MGIRLIADLIAAPRAVALPKDIVLEVFSWTDVTTLARVARVCRILRVYSNEAWQKLYQRRWREWQAPPRFDWRLHCWTVEKVQRLMGNTNPQTSLFWSFGLARESEISAPQQDTLNLQQAYVGFVHGRPQDISRTTSPPQPIPIALLILFLVRTGQISQASIQFDKHKALLKGYSLLLGWWLYEILRHYLPNLAKIHFPPLSIREDKESRNFLQGFFLLWLSHGPENTHFVTLRVLKRIAHEQKEEGQGETARGVFLEDYLIQSLTIKRWHLDLEHLATLYLDFPHQLIGESTTRDPSAKEFYLFPHDKKDFRQDELNKAMRLYLSVIQSYNINAVPLHLATNLSRTLSELTQAKTKILLLPLSIFQRVVRDRQQAIRAVDLHAVVDLVTNYHIKEAFPFIRSCLQWIHPRYTEKTVKDMFSFLIEKFNFYEEINDHLEMVYAWVEVCHFLGRQRQRLATHYDPLEVIFPLTSSKEKSILDEKSSCEAMISVQSPVAEVQIAIAYAYFKLDRIDECLKIAALCVSAIDKKHLHWLSRLGEKDVRAMVIYSLCLGYPDLENHFEESREYLSDNSEVVYENLYGKEPKREFFAYHNLAVRLYFVIARDEKHDLDMNEALKFSKAATTWCNACPETYLLISLCHAYNGDFNESQAALKQANVLSERKWTDKETFEEKDLLLLPRPKKDQS